MLPSTYLLALGGEDPQLLREGLLLLGGLNTRQTGTQLVASRYYNTTQEGLVIRFTLKFTHTIT